MLSIIIPALNEAPYLNRTIQNIFATATGQVEVIVVDQGGNGEIDPRAKVIAPGGNVGERRAMNLAAQAATGEFLLRIDAHCDFSPHGWDQMLCEATGERDLTMAVLTAVRMPWEQAPRAEKDKWLAKHKRDSWHDWERLRGHWYGLTRLIISEHDSKKGFEAKWQGANKDHNHYHGLHPTMAATGCGMCIRKAFYEEIDGADESLPPMGAIGEEFALKAWSHEGRCQTYMDVMIGHIFGTGGYPTEPVFLAQQMLYEKYQDFYPALASRPEFKSFEGLRLITARQIHITHDPQREVDVIRTDVFDSKDPEGRLIRRRVERFRYLWLASEHPGEEDLTDQQIEVKYGPRGTRISSEVFYVDAVGNMVPEPTAPALSGTP